MLRNLPFSSRRQFLKLSGITLASRTLAAPERKQITWASGLFPVGEDVIKINSNENPYGPSEEAIRAMQSSFAISCRYASNVFELDRALCAHHGVDSKMLDVGFGSSEILKMAAEAFVGPGKTIVTAHPTYEAPARYGAIYGGKAVRVPLDTEYRHDLKSMRDAVDQTTGMVYLCNPNNPTATIVSADAVSKFINSMPSEVPIVIDEAYHHYVTDPSYASAIPLAKEGKPVIVTRTFSKIYGMAGLRLGYAVGRADLIRRMSAYKVWLNANTLSVAAGLASLDDRDFVDRNRKLNSDTRQYVEQELHSMGLAYIASNANFMMIDLKQDMNSVASGLRRRGVWVGRSFSPMNQHLRVTIGTLPEMKRFISELRAVLA